MMIVLTTFRTMRINIFLHILLCLSISLKMILIKKLKIYKDDEKTNQSLNTTKEDIKGIKILEKFLLKTNKNREVV